MRPFLEGSASVPIGFEYDSHGMVWPSGALFACRSIGQRCRGTGPGPVPNEEVKELSIRVRLLFAASSVAEVTLFGKLRPRSTGLEETERGSAILHQKWMGLVKKSVQVRCVSKIGDPEKLVVPSHPLRCLKLSSVAVSTDLGIWEQPNQWIPIFQTHVGFIVRENTQPFLPVLRECGNERQASVP